MSPDTRNLLIVTPNGHYVGTQNVLYTIWFCINVYFFKDEIGLSYIKTNLYYRLSSPFIKPIPCFYQLVLNLPHIRINSILICTVWNHSVLESTHVHYILRLTVYNCIMFFLSSDGSCSSLLLTYERCGVNIFSVLLFFLTSYWSIYNFSVSVVPAIFSLCCCCFLFFLNTLMWWMSIEFSLISTYRMWWIIVL